MDQLYLGDPSVSQAHATRAPPYGQQHSTDPCQSRTLHRDLSFDQHFACRAESARGSGGSIGNPQVSDWTDRPPGPSEGWMGSINPFNGATEDLIL